MFGLKKIATIAIAVAGAVTIAVTSALVYVYRNSTAKSNESVKVERYGQQDGNSDGWKQPSTNENDQGKIEDTVSSDKSQDTFDPNIPDAYYKGTVVIKENTVFEANTQVSSFGQLESTLSSEEVLFYENKTQKLYILARKLTFEGHGTVTVKHEGGVFTGSQNIDSLGDMMESYDHLVKSTDSSPDHSGLPVRADVKESTIFTVVPTIKQDWVAKVVGKDVSLGPPEIFLSDSLIDGQIELIPGIPSIIIPRSYHASESFIDEATGMLVKPQGTFNCNFTKVSQPEALNIIEDWKKEKDQKEKDSLFNPDFQENSSQSSNVNNGEGLPLPEGYPQDVVPISSSAFVAVSETIPNENNKNGFNITLKVNQTKEEALLQYKNLLKNSSTFETNGITTIMGDKSGYEYSVMIMDNTLGGSERTMIQIIINPLED